MFNVREAKFVPGFRVIDPKEGVLGFRVARDNLVQRSAPDLLSYGRFDQDRGGWHSDYFIDASDRFARNPYLSGGLANLILQGGQYLTEQNSDWNHPSPTWSADGPDTAWAKCHARCVEQTVGRGLPDSFTAYRRCMRACLNSMGIFDY